MNMPRTVGVAAYKQTKLNSFSSSAINLPSMRKTPIVVIISHHRLFIYIIALRLKETKKKK